MFRRTILSTVAAAALAAIALPLAAQDTLRIGVEGAYPPFSSKESDGTLVGFDIDIAKALCAEMQRECELVEQEWDGMIPALKARKFDAIVASMSITEERKRQIDFSEKYYQTPARLVAPKDAGFEGTPDGLAGKRIGVQRGATHQPRAAAGFVLPQIAQPPRRVLAQMQIGVPRRRAGFGVGPFQRHRIPHVVEFPPVPLTAIRTVDPHATSPLARRPRRFSVPKKSPPEAPILAS